MRMILVPIMPMLSMLCIISISTIIPAVVVIIVAKFLRIVMVVVVVVVVVVVFCGYILYLLHASYCVLTAWGERAKRGCSPVTRFSFFLLSLTSFCFVLIVKSFRRSGKKERSKKGDRIPLPQFGSVYVPMLLYMDPNLSQEINLLNLRPNKETES